MGLLTDVRRKLYGFTPVDWSDHYLAKFLRDKDSDWKINKLNNEWTQFLCKDRVVAIVKYKNDTPIDRWIYVRITEL